MKFRNFSIIKIDPQDFVYVTGIHFEGLTISMQGDRWRIIIRGRGPRGEPCYAIYECDELFDAPGQFLAALERDSSARLWRADKFRT